MFRLLLITVLALRTPFIVFAADSSRGLPGEAELGDITKPANTPPVVQGIPIPGLRSRQEVERVLAAVKPMTDRERNQPFRVVLCAAAKDPGHGAPGLHDYPLWRERWTKILARVDGVTTEAADRWPTKAQFESADVITFFHNNPAWEAAKAPELDAFLARGGGLVFLHFSVNGGRDIEPLAARLGRVWGTGNQWRRGDVTLKYEPHPITIGFPQTDVRPEEPYWRLNGNGDGTRTIATTDEDGAPQPQVWTAERNGGRLFVCIPGHFTWTHDDPLYRVLVYRGLCWSARRPLNRLDDAVFTGTRVSAP
ncbi:MAG: ThuA domain-containing protein [Pedosphaera sp.]|nr:ThuA domain-containing protein [Pedosphaera sp.]